MDDTGIAKKLVDALFLPHEGRPRELRPVHAIGIGATGYFVASDVAREFCKAEHFQGEKVPVTVRFSNGSGSSVQRDGWSDVRGMATRFHLADGKATDLIAMTLGEFFTPTPEAFLEFVEATNPKPPPKEPLRLPRETAWGKILAMLQLMPPLRDLYPDEEKCPDSRPDPGAMTFANQHSYAELSVSQAASIGAPASYARASYHAVHTFVVEAPDGRRRWVRFTWQPVAGVKIKYPVPWTKYDPPPVDEYLQQELQDRLAETPARFILMMSIGETGDEFNDSTRPWPPHRVRVVMGTLTINKVAQDQDANCERLSFNPCRLAKGIEPSGDPILLKRHEAYEISRKQRGGAACPFSDPFSGS